ncbi:MAG: cellulase family glycosylhydrolase [Actinomycetota bacterium]
MKIRKTAICLFIAVIIFTLFNLPACTEAPEEIIVRTIPENFIYRDGDKLMKNGEEFRFMSFNMPELGMRETKYKGSRLLSIIDPFEQEDAIRTISQMGGRVTRCYVFSIISSYNSLAHIEGVGKYNEECFRAFDNLLSLCNEYGVYLIVPFIDVWSWWGGTREFCALRGEKIQSKFWTDPQIKQDFKDFISYVLNRTNTITGEAYKDDPAILAWETGNELRWSTYEWTKEMAEYIKSIDPNHLLMDGRDMQHFTESILDSNIDIITAHYYGNSFVERFREDFSRVEGLKPFIVGEFGLTGYDRIEAFVNELVTSGASGGMIWSLRQHDVNGGFIWHSEGVTHSFDAYHWPGFKEGASYDEEAIIKLMREAAYRIQGKEVPSLPAPEYAPVLLPIQSVSDIRWQGVVGASGYNIERKEGETGEWTIIAENVSDSIFDPNFILKKNIESESAGKEIEIDYRILFQDHTAEKGKTYCYRVQAINNYGVSGYSNEEKIENVRIKYGVIVDNLDDFSKMSEYSQNLELNTKDVDLYEEDASLLKRVTDETGYVVYKTPIFMNSFQIFAYSTNKNAELSIFISSNGKNFQPIESTRFTQITDNRMFYRINYFTNRIPSFTRYLKIEFGNSPVNSEQIQIGTVKLGYGSMQLIPLKVYPWSY